MLVAAEPPGILTDRDLRNRVLARDRGAETPVREVASFPVVTISAETPIYVAWQELLTHGLHHLPVSRAGEIVGVITDTDLLRHQALGPVAVLKRVERLPGRDSLPGYAREIARMVKTLVDGGLDVPPVGRLVALANDALAKRILRWAEQGLGPPPCPYAWIVFGSEGRMEQTLLTDQDNALVWRDRTPEAAEYFARLAERVVEDLVAAGFPRCAGDFMATKWRGGLSEWEERFASWLTEPTSDAIIASANFFDFRAVHGELDLFPLERLILTARDRDPFRAALVNATLQFRPPIGAFGRLRGEAEGIDVKRHGLTPIVGLARIFALEAGSSARGTLDRLAIAAGAGRVSEGGAEELTEAFRFLLRLRLREQLREARPRTDPRGPDRRRLPQLPRTGPPQGGLPGDRGCPTGRRVPISNRPLLMFGLFRRRRPAPPDLLWALDLETDGLDLRRGTILSVGMVPVRDGVVRLSGAFESRVRPPDPASLDAEAIRVHHLVREDLLGAPPLEAVVPEIGFRLEESGRLLVHHAGVDVPFLRKAFRECGRRWPSPEVVDTVDLLHRLDHRRRLVDPSERPASPSTSRRHGSASACHPTFRTTPLRTRWRRPSFTSFFVRAWGEPPRPTRSTEPGSWVIWSGRMIFRDHGEPFKLAEESACFEDGILRRIHMDEPARPGGPIPQTGGAHHALTAAEWQAIESDPDFRPLVAAKRKFIVPATVFFIVYYFALPVLVGYFPDADGDQRRRQGQHRLPLRPLAVLHGLDPHGDVRQEGAAASTSGGRRASSPRSGRGAK